MDFTEILATNEKVFVDVWATWCAPCKMTTPIVNELEAEAEDVKVVKINADDNPELVKQLNVVSVPTFIYFENGEEVNRYTGVMKKENMFALMGAV